MEQLEINEDVPYIPHEVVELVIRQNMPLVRAWRVYKGVTIEEVAKFSDLKTYEVEQLEAEDNKFSFKLEKVALGLELDVEQIVDY
jgi:hypothetical protein